MVAFKCIDWGHSDKTILLTSGLSKEFKIWMHLPPSLFFWHQLSLRALSFLEHFGQLKDIHEGDWFQWTEQNWKNQTKIELLSYREVSGTYKHMVLVQALFLISQNSLKFVRFHQAKA